MRYIDGPRKRQFGVKSGVFRSGLRSASPVGKPGLGPASKTEVDPSQATSDVANTETAPQPDEGTPNERQVADTKQDIRKSPKTSRKSASTLGARRSQTRRPKSSIHQKAVGLEKSSGRPRRKQSAPLSRPKTGRGRKESSTTREQDDDAVESGRKAPSLQFLAVAMDGDYDETSGDSKEQSQDSRRSGDVQKNGYKFIPIATRRESGTQTIAAEETAPKEPETSTKACQSGEETTKDIVAVAEDDSAVSESGVGETREEDDAVKQDNRRSLTYDKPAVKGHLEITSLANNESAKKIENPDEDNALAQDNGKALIEERATKHEIHGAENAEYEGSTTGRDYDRNDSTSDTLVRRTEDDTAQATTNDRTGITEDDDVATKKSASKPTETASPSEEDELTNRQGTKEDDRITSKDSMALKKDEDGPRTEQSRNSLEEQYAVTTSGNVQSTAEEKPSVEGQLDKTSREVDKTDPETSSSDGEYTSSSGSGDDETTDDDDAGSTTENKPAIHHPEMTSLTNERTGKKEHPHEHDVARLDNGEAVAEDEPPVEVHPEITPLTNNERGENKDILSNEGNSRTIGNETKETGKEEEGAVKQVNGTDVTDQTAAARQPVGTPMTSKIESETKAQADTDSDSLSSGSGDDSTSDSGSYSTTDSGRSAASSRQSDSKIQSTDASLPVHVKAEDQRPREDRESGSIESVDEVTPNGLTADDLARLQAAEDELSLGTPSSTENQSNESSESSSFTGRYTFTFLSK